MQDFENLIEEDSIQTTRLVVDVISNCNLGCHYCHPNIDGWSGEHIDADKIEEILIAGSSKGILETTLKGGEITMHPEFNEIMDLTNHIGEMAVSFVTNAILLDDEKIDAISNSNLLSHYTKIEKYVKIYIW